MPTQTNPYLEKNLIDFMTLLENLNHVSQIVSKYLGPKLTAHYWNASRPEYAWSKNFEINNKAKITFSGNLQTLTPGVYHFCMRQWTDAFVKECSQIMKELPQLIAQHAVSSSQKFDLAIVPKCSVAERSSFEVEEHSLFWD